MNSQTEARQMALVIKGAITEMPAEQQAKIAECTTKLISLVKEYGVEALVAMSLVSADALGD